MFWCMDLIIPVETDRRKLSIGKLMNSIKINNHDLMQTDEFNSETLSMDRTKTLAAGSQLSDQWLDKAVKKGKIGK